MVLNHWYWSVGYVSLSYAENTASLYYSVHSINQGGIFNDIVTILYHVEVWWKPTALLTNFDYMVYMENILWVGKEQHTVISGL